MYRNNFMTHPLNIIFDAYWIWLLCYKIEFSCLYTLQRQNFIRTVWLWSTA